MEKTRIIDELIKEIKDLKDKSDISSKIINEFYKIFELRIFKDEKFSEIKYHLAIFKQNHGSLHFEITKEQYEMFEKILKSEDEF